MEALRTIQIDSVDYQADEKVIASLQDATQKLDSITQALEDATNKLTTITAERDTLKDRVDSLNTEVAELKTNRLDEAAIKAAVARRLKIHEAAKKAEIEIKDDAADIDIQKSVILKVFPKAVLDDKDSVYIDARFDGAVEFMEIMNEQSNDADNRQALNPDSSKKHNDSVADSKSARQKMIDRLTNKKEE